MTDQTGHAVPPCSVDDLVAAGRALGLPRLDVRLLLAHALGQAPSWVLAHGDQPITAATAQAALELLRQRADDVPLAYLVGQHEFHGLMLQVDNRVLDPRPDSEVLADWAIDTIRANLALHRSAGHTPATRRENAGIGTPLRVADLGTGSGALALAIAHTCAEVVESGALEVWATDQSSGALAVASANAHRLGLTVRTAQGHWLDALPATPAGFGVLLSNPPYLADNDPHLNRLRHEPHAALVAGEAGFADLAHLIRNAPSRLAHGGWLLLEHGHDQGPLVAQALRQHGYGAVEHRHDLAGHCRCTGGRWPAAAVDQVDKGPPS